MKTALCVFPIISNIHKALSRMDDYVNLASQLHCDLIVFPEACLTGLELTYNFEEDSKLGLSVESSEIRQIRKMAEVAAIHIAFGWIELEKKKLYDSALLIDGNGEIILHYRRQSPGWFNPHADTKSYGCGDETIFADTKYGKTTIVICGDLFMPGIPEGISAGNPDFLIYIMARALTNSTDIQKLWNTNELPDYLVEWKKTGTTVLSVNILEKETLEESIYCGGAYVIDSHGNISASKPLMEEGLLVFE